MASGIRGLLRRAGSPHRLLILIAIAYGCAVLSQVSSLVAFNWDEVIYASQVRPGVEAVPMSAPRAWGMPLLIAPVAALTQSILVIRLYLTVLAVIGLYSAFQPWLGVFAGRGSDVSAYAAPLAAGLFATLWSTVLYGSMAYPNLWLAFALVAGVGWFCRAGCRSVRTAEDPEPGDAEVRRAPARDEQVVLLSRERRRAPEGWRALRVPGMSAYVRA